MDESSFADHASDVADRFVVPDGAARDLLVHLGELLDGEPSPLDWIVVERAYRAVRDAIEEVYRPPSPLEAQRDYDRARRELAAQGIERPAWIAADDPVVMERWAEWNRRQGDARHGTEAE